MLDTFKALKQGVIDLVREQTGQAMEVPQEKGGPALDDIDTLAMVIDGVGVALTYHPGYQKGCAFAFTEFGAIPAERELDVMRKLLEVNFMLYRGGAPTFSRDPDSGRIMLLSEIPLDQATPALVLHYLRQLVAQAQQWRHDHYLEEPARRERLDASPAI